MTKGLKYQVFISQLFLLVVVKLEQFPLLQTLNLRIWTITQILKLYSLVFDLV